MAANIAYINFMDESGRIVEMTAPEKAKWTKRLKTWLEGFTLGLVGIGIIIGSSGGGGGYKIKKIEIKTLDQNRMS